MSVKVRFAPSPTGFLHIGNARTALVTWLFARKMGGHFLLRIDDTDQERSKAEYETAIEDGLVWLHMNWDEKTRQRDRLDRYDEVIQELKASGRLYACYETPEELALKRKAALSRGAPPIYDRAALSMTEEQIQKYKDEGRTPHWRFKLEHTPIVWDDMIRGEVNFSGSDLSDPVVIREDGTPLYHLCSVIDDADYEISHVVRGEDHVSNTAAHIQMFEAMGAEVPLFAHLPLLTDIEGGKLSKRLGAMSVKEIQEQEGLEAMAIVSLLSRLGTADPIEPQNNIQHFIDSFDFARFSKGSPKFDFAELIRLNSKILHDTPLEDVKVRLAHMDLQDVHEEFWNAVRPNLEKLEDIQDWWRVTYGPVESVISDADYLMQAADVLPPEPWNDATWKDWTDAVKQKTGRKGKELFMPLREALTGMSHGPELGVLLPLIGPEKVKNRLTRHKKAA